MKIIRMNPIQSNGNGKMRAYFDIQTDDGIVIKGFRIFDGPKGLFISPPSERGRDGKYYETVLLPPDIKNSIEKLAVDDYNK